MDKLGQNAADAIDWSAPRLLCIASDFGRYDEHAVLQMNRNIELIRYRRFGDGLLLLELVNASSAQEGVGDGGGPIPPAPYRTISEMLVGLEELRAFLLAFGDDVQEKTLKYYIAFKRFKNFGCIEVHPGKGCLKAFVKLDPETATLEPDFTRDVRESGHYGTGDLEITIRSREDLEKAKTLFQKSYEAS